MADLVARLMALWTAPPADDGQAAQAFRELYLDPVPVNGVPLSATELVARARALHRAYSGLRHEPIERVDAGDRIVIAFRLHGVHDGPLATPLGEVAPTGRAVAIRTIDILTVADGRVAAVTVVSDDLSALTGLGALRLASGPPAPGRPEGAST